MSSNLRIGGLATGMDIEQIVSDMMKVQSLRREKLTQDRTILEWKQAAYRSTNSKLKALQDETFKMRMKGTFLGKSVTSSNEAVISATASTSANEATFDIKVTSLATVAVKQSTASLSALDLDKIDPTKSLWEQRDKFADPSALGTNSGDPLNFTINGKSYTFANTESLNGIISKLNVDTESEISLFYDSVTDKISVTSKATGAEAKIALTGEFWGLLQMDDVVETGTDAQLTINGLETSRSSNTFTINGVTITLKGETTDPVRLEIKRDTNAIFETIKGWVAKYNETLDVVNTALKERRFKDYRPLTEDQKAALSDKEVELWEERAKSGLLQNDAVLQGEINKMRLAIYSPVSGLDTGISQLSQLGITTGNAAFGEDGSLIITDDYLSGKLIIDEVKLQKAIEENPDGVMNIFTNRSDVPSQKGIGDRIYGALNSAMNRIADLAGKDSSGVDWSSIGKRIRSFNEQIERENDRLQMMENRYWRQFTALEKAISQMNAQSAWLTTQFSMGGMY